MRGKAKSTRKTASTPIRVEDITEVEELNPVLTRSNTREKAKSKRKTTSIPIIVEDIVEDKVDDDKEKYKNSKNWSSDDFVNLARAWSQVSQNLATTNNQKAATFWFKSSSLPDNDEDDESKDGSDVSDMSRGKSRICCRDTRIACSSSAPPRNCGDGLSAINSNDSSTLENLDTGRDVEDDLDVLIECRDVCKSFGDKHILKGVSFKIRHGEAVGIIGPSGTGKSTVLKIIAGLLAPDKGEVFIRGRKRVGLISDEEMSGLRIGLVFQSAALFDSLTVRENVGFLLYENSNMSEDQIAKLVTENLAAVGLKDVEDRMPSELSGGMKKRVALARSIIFDNTKEAIEPEVLLYDEPTAGLDPIASTVVEDLIRSVHLKNNDAAGEPGSIASYLVVTHQHSTIRRAVDRLIFLYEGKIVWQGMTHEFTTSANPIVRQMDQKQAIMKSQEHRNWADLPEHLLHLIPEKIKNHDDFIQFGAVCVPWRSVYTSALTEKQKLFIPQLPLLRCFGSSYGWLVFMDSEHRVYLFNPFLPCNNEIWLPQLFTKTTEQYLVIKAVMSANPSWFSEFVVMAICSSYDSRLGVLAYFKAGHDKSWTFLKLQTISSPYNVFVESRLHQEVFENKLHDVIYYGGKCYAINGKGNVVSINARLSQTKEEILDVEPPPLPHNVREHSLMTQVYLVESSREMLMVRHINYSDYDIVLVFKLDLNAKKWVKLSDLQGRSIFVGGYSSSISVSAANFPCCKPNCVYFITSHDHI
ncbi:hypothetical protein GIB67_008434 [Kingdonia uniflora]|uniref:ABC transporter domain-containing protein n=1 Tax=Kingdonia uniflora TaxID=39325 RepID=A0A7J7N581_9MAGN|nr:hypothetical protein GIB67_008434 [Kingdonia uniflora]